jgi:hypothetical protein
LSKVNTKIQQDKQSTPEGDSLLPQHTSRHAPPRNPSIDKSCHIDLWFIEGLCWVLSLLCFIAIALVLAHFDHQTIPD